MFTSTDTVLQQLKNRGSHVPEPQDKKNKSLIIRIGKYVDPGSAV